MSIHAKTSIRIANVMCTRATVQLTTPVSLKELVFCENESLDIVKLCEVCARETSYNAIDQTMINP